MARGGYQLKDVAVLIKRISAFRLQLVDQRPESGRLAADGKVSGCLQSHSLTLTYLALFLGNQISYCLDFCAKKFELNLAHGVLLSKIVYTYDVFLPFGENGRSLLQVPMMSRRKLSLV